MNHGLDESIKKQRLLLWTTWTLIGKTETKKIAMTICTLEKKSF